MSDALAFPALAASALTQAIGFLLHRAEVVLDRHTERRDTSEPLLPEEVPDVVVGDPGHALDFDPDEVTEERAERLETLVEALELYAENGHLVEGQDERLRRTLGRLRTLLEDVYGRRITFASEEERPASGMRIVNRARDVHGVSRALKARRVSSGVNPDILHTAEVVHPGGEMTSVEVDELL
ncbi:hypothetical protein OOK13_21150 [Streptomyces sp. NBC_00378]|uniref:hypothetical protein n=1 Tax=Streptomyces sp. NBC_00378 TaxID=2975732 RepID=UPI00225117DD|nr:hypothetical protein [Streptomyces sp. NBC_00378]MCX5111006.1 hypothetical protein [Streptomyces sp. NBC_00378]